MKRSGDTDTGRLLGYFAVIIAAGAVLLSLPAAWAGPGSRLPAIDALFVSTSAVCVTGLSTVDTSLFSRFGLVIIMGLIQAGGLGIITFTSLLLMLPGRRLAFRRLKTIRSFSMEGVEHDPARIIRDIVLFTFAIEAAGAAILWFLFDRAGVPDGVFAAAFHSVSAFCNAGFSTFSDNLEGFSRNPAVLLVVSTLVVTGGIGFVVLQDLARWALRRKRDLSYHTKLMLACTAVLIVVGAVAFWLIEGRNAFAGMSPLDRAVNALFQSITPRTAGFDAVPQEALRQPSKFITMLLMFIGGAPGSIAGGVKISAAYIVLVVMLKRANERGEINSFGRRLTPGTIDSAVIYFIKAVFLLVFAAGVLSVVEGPRGADLGAIAFEVTSAFGTVGLSLGLTPLLGVAGKLVIITTMYAGRVGLLAFAFLGGSTGRQRYVYPEAEILVG